eukprot:TRINITY_DN2968_c0_g1_i1.p1 TRINITY_DN2968_c0_g1~~TRINITY_DN2968_c0_g1_i1.p1  ORF type:complete len:1145 (+),score=118.18 TRINITY_DN2968_c0_g1_i1:80-3514(+)
MRGTAHCYGAFVYLVTAAPISRNNIALIGSLAEQLRNSSNHPDPSRDVDPELLRLTGFVPSSSSVGLCDAPLASELWSVALGHHRTAWAAVAKEKGRVWMGDIKLPCMLMKLRLLAQTEVQKIGGGTVYVGARLLAGLWHLLPADGLQEQGIAMCIVHFPANRITNTSSSWQVLSLDVPALMAYNSQGYAAAAEAALGSADSLAEGRADGEEGVVTRLEWPTSRERQGVAHRLGGPEEMAGGESTVTRETVESMTQAFREVVVDGEEAIAQASVLVQSVVFASLNVDQMLNESKVLMRQSLDGWRKLMAAERTVVPSWIFFAFLVPFFVCVPIYLILREQSWRFSSSRARLVGPAVAIATSGVPTTADEASEMTFDPKAVLSCYNTCWMWCCFMNPVSCCVWIFCCCCHTPKCCLPVPARGFDSRGVNPWAWPGADMYTTRLRDPTLSALFICMQAMLLYEQREAIEAAYSPPQEMQWISLTISYLRLFLCAGLNIMSISCQLFANNIHHSPKLQLINCVWASYYLVSFLTFNILCSGVSAADTVDILIGISVCTSIMALSLKSWLGGDKNCWHSRIMRGSHQYVRKRLRGVKKVRAATIPAIAQAPKSTAGKRLRFQSSEARAVQEVDVMPETPHLPIPWPPLLQLGFAFSAIALTNYLTWFLQEFAAVHSALRRLVLFPESIIRESMDVNATSLLALASAQPAQLVQLTANAIPIPGFGKMLAQSVDSLGLNALHDDFNSQVEWVHGVEMDVVGALRWLLIILLISAIFSMAFVAFIFVGALKGFKREYEGRVRGQRPHYRQLQPVDSTKFPGILMSVSFLAPFFSMFTCFVLGTAFVALVVYPTRTTAAWRLIISFAVPYLILTIVHAVIDQVLSKVLMTPNGEIKRPVGFSIFYSASTIIGLITGVYTSIIRIIKVGFTAVLGIATRVDMTISKDDVSDSAFASLLALVQSVNEVQNPTFICASKILMPCLDDTWLPPNTVARPSVDAAADEAQRRKVRRFRNRMWLLVTLSRNPPSKCNGFYDMQADRWFNIEKRAAEVAAESAIVALTLTARVAGGMQLMRNVCLGPLHGLQQPLSSEGRDLELASNSPTASAISHESLMEAPGGGREANLRAGVALDVGRQSASDGTLPSCTQDCGQ